MFKVNSTSSGIGRLWRGDAIISVNGTDIQVELSSFLLFPIEHYDARNIVSKERIRIQIRFIFQGNNSDVVWHRLLVDFPSIVTLEVKSCPEALDQLEQCEAKYREKYQVIILIIENNRKHGSSSQLSLEILFTSMISTKTSYSEAPLPLSLH